MKQVGSINVEHVVFVGFFFQTYNKHYDIFGRALFLCEVLLQNKIVSLKIFGTKTVLLCEAFFFK